MKRIQINAFAPFQTYFKETHEGNDFFDFALAVLNKALEGLEIKVASRDEYNAVIEVNDKDNPINTSSLYDFLMDQLGINDHEGAFLSIYNYNPGFDFSSFSLGKGGLGNDLDKANNIRKQLNEAVVGQRHVIDTVINGYIKSQTFVSENRTKPAQTYLLCGPASSGKTMICEEYAKLCETPAISFNAPDYLNARQVGRLLSFVNKNPRGIIIFNEFEGFTGDFGPLVFNIYYTGLYNGVDFTKTTIFFTTTGGEKIFRDSGLTNFSSFSSEEIIRALKEDVTETGDIKYNPYLLDLLSKENVAILNVLDYFSIQKIIANHLEKYAANFTNKTGIHVQADFIELARFVLYCNPEETNLNVLKKCAENILDEQVSYLAKNTEPQSGHALLSVVKNIQIALPKKIKDEQVKRLFAVEPLDVLVVADKEVSEFVKTLNINNVNFVFARGKNEVLNKIKDGIDVVILDPLYGIRGRTSVLDLEDVNSTGNEIFENLMNYYHQIPLYLINAKEYQIPESCFQTLLLKGAKDVIYLDREQPDAFVKVLYKAIVNWDLCVDIKYLQKEKLRLETNPTQQLVENKAGTVDAKVTLDSLALVRVLTGNLDEDYALRNINGFNDVVGNKIAKEVLMKYGRYLSNPQKFVHDGFAVPKGIILDSYRHNYGKSSLVKALSKEIGCNIVTLSCKKALSSSSSTEQLVNKFKDAFKKARRNAPAILHIVDINIAITPVSNFTNDSLISALKNELEYSVSDIAHPILVIGECFPENDTPASLKGLGMRKIMLESPTIPDRIEYIKRYFKKHNIESISETVVRNFAARCSGYDYLQLNNILDFAIHYAQGKELTDKLLTDSLDLYAMGDVSIREFAPGEKLNTAYHEMGHYLLYRLFGKKPPFVTIVARGYYLGYTRLEEKDDIKSTTKQEYLDEICDAFGGRAAEVIFSGEEKGVNSGISGDIRQATYMAQVMITKLAMGDVSMAFVPDMDVSSENPVIFNEVNRILKEQYERAIRLLTLNRKSLDKLSQLLFEKGSVIDAECEALVPDSDLIKE